MTKTVLNKELIRINFHCIHLAVIARKKIQQEEKVFSFPAPQIDSSQLTGRPILCFLYLKQIELFLRCAFGIIVLL